MWGGGQSGETKGQINLQGTYFSDVIWPHRPGGSRVSAGGSPIAVRVEGEARTCLELLSPAYVRMSPACPHQEVVKVPMAITMEPRPPVQPRAHHTSASRDQFQCDARSVGAASEAACEAPCTPRTRGRPSPSPKPCLGCRGHWGRWGWRDGPVWTQLGRTPSWERFCPPSFQPKPALSSHRSRTGSIQTETFRQ